MRVSFFEFDREAAVENEAVGLAVGRLDDAIDEIGEVQKFANSYPYDRDLPSSLPGKVDAAPQNAKNAKAALSKELAKVEKELS